MRKLLIIACGWTALVVGLIIIPLPFPLPFPVGPVLALIGSTILATHSKPYRRWMQHMRHRHAWFDKTVTFFSHRSPQAVKIMAHKTRPLAIVRRMRMRLRRRHTHESETIDVAK
jgi:uncharacterized membrane protein YbaN (DUF454 family)